MLTPIFPRLTSGGLDDTRAGVTGEDGGGLGDTLGGLTSGEVGGLLGGGEGLNLIGLVGVGSDDPALLDLNPAVKKQAKFEKVTLAKKREQARQQM